MPVESNWDSVIANLESATADVEPALAGLVSDTADQVVSDIQAEWPRRTGESAEAWTYTMDGLGVTVSNDADYAEYVHDGEAAVIAARIFEQAFGASFAAEAEALITDLLDSE